MLILDILPFWSNAFLEEMVVGFESKFGCRSDVILELESALVNALAEAE